MTKTKKKTKITLREITLRDKTFKVFDSYNQVPKVKNDHPIFRMVYGVALREHIEKIEKDIDKDKGRWELVSENEGYHYRRTNKKNGNHESVTTEAGDLIFYNESDKDYNTLLCIELKT